MEITAEMRVKGGHIIIIRESQPNHKTTVKNVQEAIAEFTAKPVEIDGQTIKVQIVK